MEKEDDYDEIPVKSFTVMNLKEMSVVPSLPTSNTVLLTDLSLFSAY